MFIYRTRKLISWSWPLETNAHCLRPLYLFVVHIPLMIHKYNWSFRLLYYSQQLKSITVLIIFNDLGACFPSHSPFRFIWFTITIDTQIPKIFKKNGVSAWKLWFFPWLCHLIELDDDWIVFISFDFLPYELFRSHASPK